MWIKFFDMQLMCYTLGHPPTFVCTIVFMSWMERQGQTEQRGQGVPMGATSIHFPVATSNHSACKRNNFNHSHSFVLVGKVPTSEPTALIKEESMAIHGSTSSNEERPKDKNNPFGKYQKN